MKNLKKNRNKKSRFGRFMIIYISVLAVLIVFTWWLLYAFIGDYEESRPANTIDKVMEQLDNGNVTAVLEKASVETNEFESNTERLSSYLTDAMSGKNLRYVKKSGEYSESTPVYLIYADDSAVAKVTLIPAGENKFNFTLWKLGKIYVGSDLSNKKTDDISITVPKDSIVTINGVAVGGSYITEDNIEFTPCKNVGEYVDKPLKTTYTVSGLMMEPVVEVIYNGTALDVTNDRGKYLAQYPGDDSLMADMEKSIKELDHAYGKYIINKGKLSAVTSNMIGNAKEYMSDIPAVWAYLYGKEYTYEFQNENIDNFTRYSQDCFSCDVYYDLYVRWNGGNVTYNTSLTYTYVYYDNRWVVADFAIK